MASGTKTAKDSKPLKKASIPAVSTACTTRLILAFGAAALTACGSIEVLSEEPPNITLAHGKVVYVDDGSCPVGEVKQITGGNQQMNIPRTRACVKRPE